MALQKYSYEEMLLVRMLELNGLMPHYFSELILLAEQLLSSEEREQLHAKIFEVEKMVLEVEVVPKETQDGKMIWVERIRGKLSLYDIEMATESNVDYYSYFERDDGTKVSKFDVERKLNEIKSWLYSKVRERSSQRRFSKFR
jgi:hypothetical protein